MFWKKKKVKTRTPVVATNEVSREAAKACHTKYANLDLRRAVLDWRDLQIENVERHLNRELNELYRLLDRELEKMSMRDLCTKGHFGRKHIDPIYKEWVTQETTQLTRAAQDELSKAFVHALEFNEHGSALSQRTDSGHYTDAAFAAAATGAGIAAIPIFTTMSVVSVGGIMGLLGATTVVLPLVALGIATVGALLALGGYKAVSLKSRAIHRYRKAIIQSIESQVLGREANQDSVCKRLQSYIQQTSETIITEIDQC